MVRTGYEAHGAPPALNDDGTIAPTAPGGAMAFTPEYLTADFAILLQPLPDTYLDGQWLS